MRVARISVLIAMVIAATGCAKLTLAWADLDARGAAAQPPIFAGETPTLEHWRNSERPKLLEAFEEHVYGYMPDQSTTTILSRRTIDDAAFGGRGVLEEFELSAAATFGEETRTTSTFYVDVVLPVSSSKPAPIILMETFCPRWDTIAHAGVHRPEHASSCNDGGISTGIMHYVFGRYLATPPMEMILDAGYGVAAIFPGEVVPDSREEGLAALAELSEGHANDETRWGAISAWAWVFSRAVDALETDVRIDQTRLITWGHSRYAKSALVAAAYDQRIGGVIAHQSGTGGASLNRGKPGESVASITSSYPHWFSKRYAGYGGSEDEMPVDQHELLALVAPRPILLGNARRDVWSDPAGAFKAAVGANPVYRLYGQVGVEQDRLVPFKPNSSLAFWIRPGTHGVVKEDWPAFLEFLDAHFKEPPASSPTN